MLLYMHLRIFFSISSKILLKFWLNIDQIGENLHLNHSEYSSQWITTTLILALSIYLDFLWLLTSVFYIYWHTDSKHTFLLYIKYLMFINVFRISIIDPLFVLDVSYFVSSLFPLVSLTSNLGLLFIFSKNKTLVS